MNKPFSKADLQIELDAAFDRYNTPRFIEDDPISIPHRFDKKEDIEISGFLTALIAWGRRSMIMRNAEGLMERMDNAPYQFVMNANDAELEHLNGFVHRTMNGEDAKALIKGLKQVYQKDGGLESIFSSGIDKESEDVFSAIVNARNQLTTDPDFPHRTHKHLANPAKGSSAKRINMFLRWMVREDNRGVDFGIWKSIRPDQLICPLDVHTGNVGRKLGLLTRKQNDWKAAKELTNQLKQFSAEDPVKYDFSLFGMGVYAGI